MPLFSGQRKFLRAFNNILLAGKIAGGLATAGAGVYGLYKGGEALVNQLRSKINQIGFPPEWARSLIQNEPNPDEKDIIELEGQGGLGLFAEEAIDERMHESIRDDLPFMEDLELQNARDVETLKSLYHEASFSELPKDQMKELRALEKRLYSPSVYDSKITRPINELTGKPIYIIDPDRLNQNQRDELDRARLKFIDDAGYFGRTVTKADSKIIDTLEKRIANRQYNLRPRINEREAADEARNKGIMKQNKLNAQLEEAIHLTRAEPKNKSKLSNKDTFGRGDQPQRGVEEGIQEEADALREVVAGPDIVSPRVKKPSSQSQLLEESQPSGRYPKPKLSRPNKLSAANTFGTGVGAGIAGIPLQEQPAKPGPGGARGYGVPPDIPITVTPRPERPARSKSSSSTEIREQIGLDEFREYVIDMRLPFTQLIHPAIKQSKRKLYLTELVHKKDLSLDRLVGDNKYFERNFNKIVKYHNKTSSERRRSR